jgi:hypothetical protein
MINHMERLTLESATNNKLSPIDCIKYYRPYWTIEACHYFLWKHIYNPFSVEQTIKQLDRDFIHEHTMYSFADN